MSNFEDVTEFQRKFFRQPVDDRPHQLFPGMFDEEAQVCILGMKQVEGYIKMRRRSDDLIWGRIQMMLEEVRELAQAVRANDLAQQADSLVDLVYFALGTAVMMGLPWEALFSEVHAANMRKVPVESAGESARLNKLDAKKPEGWKSPDIKSILERTGGSWKALFAVGESIAPRSGS